MQWDGKNQPPTRLQHTRQLGKSLPVILHVLDDVESGHEAKTFIVERQLCNFASTGKSARLIQSVNGRSTEVEKVRPHYRQAGT